MEKTIFKLNDLETKAISSNCLKFIIHEMKSATNSIMLLGSKLVVLILLFLGGYIVSFGFSTKVMAAPPKTIKICIDTNFWYPFTFQEGGKAMGMHVDIVTRALEELGLNHKFTPMPWERCLKAEAKRGRVDAIVSASYKPDRAEYLYYPDGATEKKAALRLMQTEYVVVGLADSSFEFNGDVLTLPTPVRVPRGYSLVKDLQDKGVLVDTAIGDRNNLSKMLRDGKGVVVSSPLSAEVFSKESAFAGKIKIHQVPIASKSYFMVFSKRGSVDEATRSKIWEHVAKLRDNEEYMLSLLEKY